MAATRLRGGRSWHVRANGEKPRADVRCSLLLIGGAHAHAAADFIEGRVVSGAKPEAGVWVIAETASLPTPYRKIVVTNDDGRFVDSRSARRRLSGVGARLRSGRFGENACHARCVAHAADRCRGESAGRGDDLSGELLAVAARAARPRSRLGESVQARVPAVSSGRLGDHAHEEPGDVRPRLQESDLHERDRGRTRPSAPARRARRLVEADRRGRSARSAAATARRRTQRRDHAVGVGRHVHVRARRDRDRQAQSVAVSEWTDLRRRSRQRPRARGRSGEAHARRHRKCRRWAVTTRRGAISRTNRSAHRRRCRPASVRSVVRCRKASPDSRASIRTRQTRTTRCSTRRVASGSRRRSAANGATICRRSAKVRRRSRRTTTTGSSAGSIPKTQSYQADRHVLRHASPAVRRRRRAVDQRRFVRARLVRSGQIRSGETRDAEGGAGLVGTRRRLRRRRQEGHAAGRLQLRRHPESERPQRVDRATRRRSGRRARLPRPARSLRPRARRVRDVHAAETGLGSARRRRRLERHHLGGARRQRSSREIRPLEVQADVGHRRSMSGRLDAVSQSRPADAHGAQARRTRRAPTSTTTCSSTSSTRSASARTWS